MSRTVRVELADRSYDIRIGGGMQPAVFLRGEGRTRCLVVTDSHVAPLYGEQCEASLRGDGFQTWRATVPAGEESKSLDQAARLYGQSLSAGLDRRSVIVALGGGMVGDLAGFVAATYLRGIRFIQVPTTLLAMVDSSVGGKTGVNLPEGKNLVGSFHQPIGVTADLGALKTLPPREYASGLAEVVKYGLIWDAAFLGRIEQEAGPLVARDAEALERVVARCCEIKAEVVGMDEHESGVRSILNFGHTLGHALENAAGYGALLHGEAVSIGMAYALGLSAAVKGLPRTEVERVRGLLRRLGLPVSPGDVGLSLAWPQMAELMAADKKSVQRSPRFVLLSRIGGAAFGVEIQSDALEAAFEAL